MTTPGGSLPRLKHASYEVAPSIEYDPSAFDKQLFRHRSDEYVEVARADTSCCNVDLRK